MRLGPVLADPRPYSVIASFSPEATIYTLKQKKGGCNPGGDNLAAAAVADGGIEAIRGGAGLPPSAKKVRHASPGASSSQPGNAGSDDPGAYAAAGAGVTAGSHSGSKPERPATADGLPYSATAVSDCGARRTSGSGAAPQGVLSPPHSPYKDILVVPATSDGSVSKDSAGELNEYGIFRQDFNAPCAQVVVGECDNCGQRAVKVIYCGKEWCSLCGQRGSPTHNDRYAKWLSRARQMSSMGYWDVEWPLKYRHDKSRVYSAEGLRNISNKVVEVFAGKRMGRRGRVGGYFDRGMMRWHWFGDYAGLFHGIEIDLDHLRGSYAKAFRELCGAVRAKAEGVCLAINHSKSAIFFSNPGGQHACIVERLVADFANTNGLHIFPYSNIPFNPHLNILVDSGRIRKKLLKEIKAALREALDCPDLIVHYSYRQTPGEMAHTVRYVTRATFRDREWSPYMARELFETRQPVKKKNPKTDRTEVVVPFRNSRTWGKWDKPQVWETEGQQVYEKILKLRGENKCGKCGNQMKWSSPLPMKYLVTLHDLGVLKAIVPGYYEFTDPEYHGPPKGVDPVMVVDGATGELVPVENTVLRRKLLRGDYEQLARMVKMTERRVKFVEECRRLGIDWRDEAMKYENEEGYWSG